MIYKDIKEKISFLKETKKKKKKKKGYQYSVIFHLSGSRGIFKQWHLRDGEPPRRARETHLRSG